MARGLRAQAMKARELQNNGQHGMALAFAIGLADDNPRCALVLNLLGSIHRHFGSAAWDGRFSDNNEAASKMEFHHHHRALDAFSKAAQIAPDCVLTAICHAEALAACSRLVDAELELLRICSIPEPDHADPALHHVGYELVSTAEKRKSDAVKKAHVIRRKFEAIINNQIVPVEAASLLGGDADKVRRRADLFYRAYPYSVRAHLLLVYVELEHARGLDLVADKRRHLRRVLALISEAAVAFDCSLLIALFHANVLFVLDEFDESERECRRALRIQEPTDPDLDDIPPAVSVPGADYDSRVSAVKKQIRILLKRIIVVAAVCWSSIKSTQHAERVERVISVRADTLQGHYNGKPAADAISDTLRFHKNHSSWSFLVCPISSCRDTKFLGTKSLWEHMRGKHDRYVLWSKLQSVLGAVLYENASKDDHSFDGIITLRQDSNKHNIFHLPRVQPMFESLLLSPSIGIQAESLAEIRQRKCREGAEVIEDIKEKLSLLPKDEVSAEYVELCFAIQELWLKFLKTSALDHREVILPLARSFQWMQMKNSIALSVNDLGRFIGGANIDTMFGKVPAAPYRKISVVHGSKPSHASNIYNRSGEDLQTKNLQLLCSDETLTDGEKCEESEVHAIDSNSETMVDQRSTDPTIDVHDAATIILSMHQDTSFAFSQKRITEVEIENKDRSEKANCSYNNDGEKEKGNVLSLKNIPPIIPHDAFVGNAQNDHSHARLVPLEGCSASDSEAVQFHLERWDAAVKLCSDLKVSSGTSVQSVKEMASTSSCQQSLNVFNKNNADKELSILSLVVRSLCNLSHFRDKFLTEPLVWIPSADNVCIAQQFYEIFTSWEKNDTNTLLCGIDCTIFSEKLQVGTNFASEIVATILIGLHMSETCSRFSLNKETEKHVVNPITCGYCTCPTHNLFGIKYSAQMSSECEKCSGEYLYTALFHKLDAGSPETTKIKSFAELPVLFDEQFCKDNKCEDCGSLLDIDLFLSNTPHFFTIVLNWLGSCESQDTLSEVLAGITSPVDTKFFCKSADSSTMYKVTSMAYCKICCVDESYVYFARHDEDKWLIYDFETVETEDTWEHLLERFKDRKLQPEVLFFEVIK